MEPEDKAAKLQETRAEKCHRRLAHFIRYGWHVLEPGVELSWNWHIDAIADHVQWVLEDWMCWQISRMWRVDEKRAATVRIFGRDRAEKILPTLTRQYKQRARNFLTNVPPGTAKSRIISVFAPAWMWLPSKWPSWRVLCLSANPDVAIRDAMYCRDLLGSEWYQEWFEPDWSIRDDQDAKSNYGNTAGGTRSSKGLNARVVGQRGDAIIIDDPHDPKEAASETLRTSVIENWKASAANRVNDLRSSVRLGVMQRVHEADWSGYVLEQGDWEHLCLPMEYEPSRACTTVFGWSDPRTAEGEVLHPERFTPEVLAAERVRLGSYGYASQMQQLPAPAEGGMFKRSWWRFFKLDGTGTARPRPTGCSTEPAVTAPAFDRIVITVDAAFKKLEDGSRVSIQVIGAKGPDRYVLADRTCKRDFKETVTAILQAMSDYPKATRVLIEDKANGTAVINVLRGLVAGIVAVEPAGGKESRAAAIQPQVESSNVYLLDGAGWLDDFVTELSVFPNGAHDDRVDALSQALIDMAGSVAVGRFIAAWA